MNSISPSVLVVTVVAASLMSAAAAALTVRLAGAALASRIQLATIGRMRIILVALVTAAAVSAQRPEDLIAAGPMIGHTTETEVSLWARTTIPARVAFKYWPEGDLPAARWSKTVTTREDEALCATVRIGGLPFGARYRFALSVNGDLAPRPYKTAFRTQPHWRWRRPPPDLTVAFGSCAYVNDTPFDRPGAPYGDEDLGIFETIAGFNPDLMLWAGDNVYLREPDWSSESGIRARYAKTRATTELQRLLAACPQYATWDDHDFGPNNSDWTNPLRGAALRTFKLFWANPSYGLADTPGVFTRFTWSDVEFFLLDDRYHRSPNAAPETMWGKTQLRWLTDALTSSEHAFKVVVNGNQVWNQESQHETAARYVADLKRLRAVIDERRISGVLFLSGDRHHTELLRIGEKAPIYEFTSSPLLSSLHTEFTELELKNSRRVKGTLFSAERNFGILRFTGEGAERAVTFECVDKHGTSRWKHRVKLSALQRR
ncbi:MAG: alkaline phosphatase D family protein [Planctomycetota bacterium]|nr:alkaline phosphatase D family protein [Planctomycetota bacterium]